MMCFNPKRARSTKPAKWSLHVKPCHPPCHQSMDKPRKSHWSIKSSMDQGGTKQEVPPKDEVTDQWDQHLGQRGRPIGQGVGLADLTISLGHLPKPSWHVGQASRRRREWATIYMGVDWPDQSTLPPSTPLHDMWDRFLEGVEVEVGQGPLGGWPTYPLPTKVIHQPCMPSCKHKKHVLYLLYPFYGSLIQRRAMEVMRIADMALE